VEDPCLGPGCPCRLLSDQLSDIFLSIIENGFTIQEERRFHSLSKERDTSE
jgi:hypothetical protein